jgi:hypothetical protein
LVAIAKRGARVRQLRHALGGIIPDVGWNGASILFSCASGRLARETVEQSYDAYFLSWALGVWASPFYFKICSDACRRKSIPTFEESVPSVSWRNLGSYVSCQGSGFGGQGSEITGQRSVVGFRPSAIRLPTLFRFLAVNILTRGRGISRSRNGHQAGDAGDVVNIGCAGRAQCFQGSL